MLVETDSKSGNELVCVETVLEVCVETVIEMCVSKLYFKCVCVLKLQLSFYNRTSD